MIAVSAIEMASIAESAGIAVCLPGIRVSAAKQGHLAELWIRFRFENGRFGIQLCCFCTTGSAALLAILR